jgi:uncharacterized protein
MGSLLTERATPAELANRLQLIETEENILCFPRLAEFVRAELDGIPGTDPVVRWRHFPVAIRLRFAWADSRRELVSLTGELRARIGAICQRCLEPFEFELRNELNLLLLPPGSVSGSEATGETWELDDEWLRPGDIVDEALIMALPLAARHEDDTGCSATTPDSPEKRSDTVRPFAKLKSQLRD